MIKAMIDAWYSPSQINYSVEQLRSFLLPNLQTLRDGEYPPDPRDTGYERTSHRMDRSSASFCTPCELAAEIEVRLAQIGNDGSIILLLYVYGHTLSEVAMKHKRTEYEILRDSGKMLRYISGYKRKLMTYDAWLTMRAQHRVYEQNHKIRSKC